MLSKGGFRCCSLVIVELYHKSISCCNRRKKCFEYIAKSWLIAKVLFCALFFVEKSRPLTPTFFDSKKNRTWTERSFCVIFVGVGSGGLNELGGGRHGIKRNQSSIFWFFLKNNCFFCWQMEIFILKRGGKGRRTKAMDNLGGAMGQTKCTLIKSYWLKKSTRRVIIFVSLKRPTMANIKVQFCPKNCF